MKSYSQSVRALYKPNIKIRQREGVIDIDAKIQNLENERKDIMNEYAYYN